MIRFIFLILIIPIAFELNAKQCDIPVNETFDSVPFLDFVHHMEESYKVHFFLKPAWVDSLCITSNKIPTTLQEILNENFKGTKISYFIYNCEKIILTKDYTYLEDIPESIIKQINIPALPQEKKYEEISFVKHEFTNGYQGKKNIITIGDPSKKYVGKNAKVSGYINDTVNNVPIVGAVIFFDDFRSATITDENGFYSVIISTGTHVMHIRCVGKIEKTRKVVIFGNGIFNETLEDNALSLQEVYIYANEEHNVRDLQLGVEKMDISMIKQIPTSVGEADIFKMALLLPGVQTVGEGASGFNVRGGSVDQNLILIDNSPIYNSSHLFGFFSTINTEMVKDFELFKSSYPAYYGGRLSSVFAVNLKKGDPEKFSLKGGISPITGKLLLEGPIVRNKVSFIISGRSTYSDWLLKRINSPMLQNSNASFYDLNAKINANLNKNNMLQLSSYYSYDYFKLNSDTGYTYENLNGSLLWKHTFSDHLSFTTMGIFSEYQYNVGSTADPLYAFNLTYDIQHYEGKMDLLYLPNDKHKIRFGVNSIKYNLNPGTLKPAADANIAAVQLNSEQGVESAVYINDEFNINNRILINQGFRYSFFYSLGPAKIYKYADGSPRDYDTRIDSTFYKKNAISGKYGNPEYRVSIRYQLSADNSIKVSYANMTQYIHMLTNTMAVSPTDTWTLSNPNLKPQRSWQFSLGYYYNFNNNMYETSVETYYKESENIMEFKPGAQLLLNPDLELDLLAGKGRAYGAEFMIKKKSGKLNGWLSYTYSRSLIRVDSKYYDERINSGNYYPTNYDKPHDFTMVSNYKFSRRISASATATYGTGHPITYPVAWYTLRGRELLHYSNRNEYRIPDYFRIDLSLNIEGNLKLKKLAHNSWSFSVYNLTGRDNVYSVYFVSDPYKNIKGYKLSIFTRPIPSISYNFKF
jgi:hypothetical protein